MAESKELQEMHQKVSDQRRKIHDEKAAIVETSRRLSGLVQYLEMSSNDHYALVNELLHVRDRPVETESRITASEALYGFVAWLTGRSKPATFSCHHHSSAAIDLVKRWMAANDLPAPRGGVLVNHPDSDPRDKEKHPMSELRDTIEMGMQSNGDCVTEVVEERSHAESPADPSQPFYRRANGTLTDMTTVEMCGLMELVGAKVRILVEPVFDSGILCSTVEAPAYGKPTYITGVVIVAGGLSRVRDLDWVKISIDEGEKRPLRAMFLHRRHPFKVYPRESEE